MPQDFDLRINGKSELIKNARFIEVFDEATDSFVAELIADPINNRDLYEAIKPKKFTPVEIYLDSELKFIGKITKTEPRKSPTETTHTIHGFSNTFNFVDSALKPPYEYNYLTLHQMADSVAKQTATPVEFNTPPGGIFYRKTAKKGQTGWQFLGPLAFERSQVIGNTIQGGLNFKQANTTQAPIGTIKESDPNSLFQKEFVASYDSRQRFNVYQVSSTSAFGRTTAFAFDNTITEPRRKIMTANDHVPGGVENIAEWSKNIDIINGLVQKIPVVGWRGPNKKLWKTDSLITVISDTLYIPDGFTYYIKEVEFIIDGSTKTSVLSLIPPNTYTNLPVVEPF